MKNSIGSFFFYCGKGSRPYLFNTSDRGRHNTIALFINNAKLKRKEIIRLLKENGGEMEEEKVCTLLGIDICEIPWGYNIGWGVCLQVGGTHYLILSGQ